MRRWKLSAVLGFWVVSLGGPLGAQIVPSRTFDPKSGRFAQSLSESRRPPDTLAVGSARVWQALVVVYDQLGIPLSVADTETHVIGAYEVSRRRPVAGQRLSQVLECGDGTYGANADRYPVQLTALAAATPIDATHTALLTRVGGTAEMNGSSSKISCSSTGRLEQRIVDEVKKLVGN